MLTQWVWLKQIVGVLCALWLGGVAPLIYVNAFATHHQVQAYSFALWDSPPPARTMPHEAKLQYLKIRLDTPQTAVVMARIPTGVTSLYQSLVNHDNWLLAHLLDVSTPHPVGRVDLTMLPHDSAVLPPPDKPPRL